MRRSQSAVELRSMNSLARHSSASDLSQLDQARPQASELARCRGTCSAACRAACCERGRMLRAWAHAGDNTIVLNRPAPVTKAGTKRCVLVVEAVYAL